MRRGHSVAAIARTDRSRLFDDVLKHALAEEHDYAKEDHGQEGGSVAFPNEPREQQQRDDYGDH